MTKESRTTIDARDAEIAERDRHLATVREGHEREVSKLTRERDEARTERDVFNLAGQQLASERAKALAERDALKARAEKAEAERDALVGQIVALFGYEDVSYLHASLHIENAVNNLRSDLKVAQDEARRVLSEACRKLEPRGHIGDPVDCIVCGEYAPDNDGPCTSRYDLAVERRSLRAERDALTAQVVVLVAAGRQALSELQERSRQLFDARCGPEEWQSNIDACNALSAALSSLPEAATKLAAEHAALRKAASDVAHRLLLRAEWYRKADHPKGFPADGAAAAAAILEEQAAALLRTSTTLRTSDTGGR